ncbi:MAG: GH3 auxin-responsive promoter family protein [Candidatus Hodarchaeota archaeon]
MGLFELMGKKLVKFFTGYSEYFLAEPVLTQEKALGEIMSRNKDTLFGKKHGFDDVKTARDFQKRCDVHSYDYFKPYIDAFLEGNKKAFCSDKLLYFAQTSGTTGTPKLIPVTSKLLTYYTLGFVRVAAYYIALDPVRNSGILNGKWLYLPAPPVLRYKSGVPVGYITGLLFLPYGSQFWRKFLNIKSYAPLHLMHLKDVEMKFRKIYEDCAKKNITALTGVTPVVVNLLEYMLKFSGAKQVKEIFPNLQFAIFSGVSPKFYKARLRQLVGRDIAIREEYAASEGMIGVQLSDRSQFTPMYDKVFFEFVPVNDPGDRVLINQIKKGKEYKVIITTYSGLYGYDIGDVVEFVSIDPPEFIFSFRKNVIDLADEKLTPPQVLAAIERVNANHGSRMTDFCLIGTYDPKPHYILAIEFAPGSKEPNKHQFLLDLDKALETENDIYYHNRNGSNKGTLSPPELWILKKDTFISLEKQKGLEGAPIGQAKSTHVTKDAKLRDFFKDFSKDKISM